MAASALGGPELALQRIRENIMAHQRGEDARVLDLSTCGLSYVPDEAFQCHWIEELDLSQNRSLSDIRPIEKWGKLQKLDISFTAVDDLDPLYYAVNLETLLCSFTGVADLSPLSELKALHTLKCYNTRVSDLSPLRFIPSLRVLNCSETPVSDLEPILPHLDRGIRITLQGNTSDGVFDFKDCPITNPPLEVVKQGSEAVLRYFNRDVYEEESPRIKNTEREPTAMVRRYPGLRPFNRSEAYIFYGRSQETETLANQIDRERLTIITGHDGVGKTSLLQAGIAPNLEQLGYLPIFIRLNNPAEPLVESIHQRLVEVASGAQDGATTALHQLTNVARRVNLWEDLQLYNFSKNGTLLTPVLIFDQFEELFLLPHSGESKNIFWEQLGELLNTGIPDRIQRELNRISDAITTDQHRLGEKLMDYNILLNKLRSPLKVRIVISIRDSMMEQLTAQHQILSSYLSYVYKLDYLTREAGNEAITMPAQSEGIPFASRPFRFDEAALAEINDFLAANSTFVHLQQICQGIEELIIRQERPSGFTVTPEFYGGRDGLQKLTEFPYLQIISNLPQEEIPKVREMIETGLISENRRRLSLAKGFLTLNYEVQTETLDQLLFSRLLRSNYIGGEEFYEISHDALLSTILKAKAERLAQKEEFEQLHKVKPAENPTTDFLTRLQSPGPKRILAIEGGTGVPGDQIALLTALERRLQQESQNPQLRLCDVFDLIGGGGFGNLIALQLVLGIKMDEQGLLGMTEKLTELGYADTIPPEMYASLFDEFIRNNPTIQWQTGCLFYQFGETGDYLKFANFGKEEAVARSFFENLKSYTPSNLLYPADVALLDAATAPDQFNWEPGANLHILSIENPPPMPDVPAQNTNPAEELEALAELSNDVQLQFKTLASWIYTGHDGASPLGDAPARITRVYMEAAPKESKLSQTGRYFQRFGIAGDIIEKIDLSAFVNTPVTS